MERLGSRSGHSKRSDSGSYRETGSSSSFNTPRQDSAAELSGPTEQGIEVVKQPRGNHHLSTSFAGIVRTRKDGTKEPDLSRSQHSRDDLEVVPEAPAKMERPSAGSLNPPTEELNRIPYEEYSDTSHSHDDLLLDRSGHILDKSGHVMERSQLIDRSERAHDKSDRMEGSYRMIDRNTDFSRHDSLPRPSSQSVVSDVSYGDKPYNSMPGSAMPMASRGLMQDSGSLLPHLNTSHKSACSLTHGSKRMAEKRASLLRSGSILYCDKTRDAKKAEDEALEFTRWGGRKDYGSSSREFKKKAGSVKIQKKKGKQKSKQRSKHQNMRKDGRKSGFHDLWGFVRQDQIQYDQLIKEDKDRELVASYCEEPFWKIIFHFKGTVLRVIIEDILFWLTLATFASIRIKLRYSPQEEVAQVNYENLSANLTYVGGFLLFFLVFYVNQNHHRYFGLHNDSMILMGRVNDMATMVRAVLPMERGRRINRFMNAAHVAMYTGLSSTYEKENFFDPLEARFALLTDEELDRVANEIDVDNSGAKASFEIITWIMCDIRDAQINSFIDTNEAMQMRQLLLKFRSTIAKVFVTTTLPIPFFYVHFLSMLTAVYLPLFAVVVAYETGGQSENSNVWVGEVVSGLVVFLQALFVIGLRILGQQLSDPYGGDLIDLQIARYVNMILNGSNQILCSKRLHEPSVETELRLQLKMSSLGQAYEYDTDDEFVVQH